MSEKSITEAAASGDMSAAISENPNWKPTPEELVEFFIPHRAFQNLRLTPVIEQAFHFDAGSYSIMETLKVTCRPDQFGRFCALLSMNGLNSNLFIESARLFTPKPEPKRNAIDARYLGLPE